MIPTVKKFLDEYPSYNKRVPETVKITIEGAVIELIKLHTKAALENAAKYADLHSKYKPQIGEQPDINCNKYIYQNSILNSYPLNQIK